MVIAGCADGVRNFAETAVDCGGPFCLPCADQDACAKNRDCASDHCQAGTCAAATCADGRRNGLETDADCGGSDCPRCNPGRLCLSSGDCAAGYCLAGRCQDNTCRNGAKDPTEGGVDCGGPRCAPCEDGSGCGAHADCASGTCQGGRCQASLRCADGVRDGDETDVDCGGSCQACSAGRRCLAGADCATRLCTTAVLWSDAQWRASNSAPSGWYEPGYDDSSWAPAVEEAAFGADPWGTQAVMSDDTPAFWVWSHLSLGNEIGDAVYLRRSFVVPRGPLSIRVTADDSYTLLAAGSQLGSGQDWRTPTTYELRVSPGTRTQLAIFAQSAPAAGTRSAGVLVDVRSGERLCRTLP